MIKPVNKICAFCNKEFVSTTSAKCCSRSCASTLMCKKRHVDPKNLKHYYYIRQCDYCHADYEAYSARKNTRFCSKKCQNEARSIEYKGREITPEWLANMNASKTREKIVKYGNFTCEVCNKIFETNLSLRSHRSYCSNTTEKVDVTCELCGKKFTRHRNLVVHLKLKHDEVVNAQFRITVKEGCKKRETQRTSTEEILFFEKLKSIYDVVLHKHKVEGISHEFDYFVPSQNLLIEYDGDYWHGNPKTQTLSQGMKRQFYIDLEYTRAAINLGYKVHRIWSSEAEQYPHKMRELDVRSNICENSIDQATSQKEKNV